MPIIAREPESKFTPAPEGLYAAVCCDVVDKGLLDDGFGLKEKVDIWWQLELVNEETDKRFLIRRRYTNSLHEKANLCKDLELWRGRKFTEEERRGFDLEKLIGVPCQVQVIHKDLDDGRVFANVAAVIGISKGMPRPRVSDDYVRIKDRAKTQQVTDANGKADEPDDVPF